MRPKSYMVEIYCIKKVGNRRSFIADIYIRAIHQPEKLCSRNVMKLKSRYVAEIYYPRKLYNWNMYVHCLNQKSYVAGR